jgi:hypothetical protein
LCPGRRHEHGSGVYPGGAEGVGERPCSVYGHAQKSLGTPFFLRGPFVGRLGTIATAKYLLTHLPQWNLPSVPRQNTYPLILRICRLSKCHHSKVKIETWGSFPISSPLLSFTSISPSPGWQYLQITTQ